MDSQVWWRKNHGLGLHPAWGCARDLQSGWQHQQLEVSKKLLLPLTFQILQQDAAPSCTSASTSKFLKAKKVKVLQDWPVWTPDINIIEHVWGRVKEEAWKMKPKNLDELWESCKTAFFAILGNFISKLFESLLRCMDVVLQAHGSHTQYQFHTINFWRHHDFMSWCYRSMLVSSK